jgi:radical SAM protein with 4Fe4S-binding SPASM domain
MLDHLYGVSGDGVEVNSESMLPDPPFALHVESSSDCNLTCCMCPRVTRRTLSSLRPGHMTETVWDEIVSAVREVGQVILGGYGEPLADPQYVSRLQQLDSMGIWTSISTNGTLLTQAAGELAQLQHLTHINVSIDSSNPEAYRKIRGGELERALTGIGNLMTAFDDPARIAVVSVVMNRNLAGLVALPPVLAGLGVKRYILQSLIDYNPELHRENLLYQEGVCEHLDQIKKACTQAGIELLFTLPERLDLELKDPPRALQIYYGERGFVENATRKCCLPWEMPFIDKDGRVFPCCYASTRRAPVLGNLTESSLVDIWRGAAYQAFRDQILDGRTVPQVCRGCTAVAIGEHPLRHYSARILWQRSVLADPGHLCLVAQNTGSRAWTQDIHLRVGTTNPRDHTSAYYDASWLGRNRICSFNEQVVSPGEVATFTFRANPVAGVPSEAFQLVVDTACWLPGTRFLLRLGNAAEKLAESRLLASATATDVERLDSLIDAIGAHSDVLARGYEVHSHVPLAGPFITWVRRNLTSHLREPYLDPTIERQVAMNSEMVTALRELLRQQADLEMQLTRLEVKAIDGSPSPRMSI